MPGPLKRVGADAATLVLGAVFFATLAVGAYLLYVARDSASNADLQRRVSVAYEAARFGLADEESTERNYRLEPGPDVRAHWATAVASVMSGLQQAGAIGDSQDRQTVVRVLPAHEGYTQAIGRLFDAVDAGRLDEANAIDAVEVDPAFDALQAEINVEATEHAAAAQTSADRAANLQQFALIASPFAGALGLAVAALLWGLLQRRRADALRSRQEGIESSEKRFRALARNSLDPVLVVSPEGVVTYASPVTDMHYRFGHVTGSDVTEFIDPADLAPATEFFQNLVASRGETLKAELRAHDATGQEIDFEVTACNLAGDPDINGLVLNLHDVTERRQLERAKERYLKFFMLSNDAMCIADPFGCFLQVNPAFETMTGYSADELVAEPFLDFVTAEDRERTSQEMALQVSTRSTLNFENRYVRKGGSLILLSWNAYFDKLDGVTYATARDITERRAAVEALRRSESLLARTQAVSKVGGWDFDVATGAFTWTDEVRRIYELDPGYDPNDGDHGMSLYGAAERASMESAFQRAVHDGEPYSLEAQLTTPGGTRKWVATSGEVERIDGKITRVFGNIVDITQQKRAEEQLRQAWQFAESVIETANVIFVQLDARGRVVRVNRTATEITGYSREELLGEHCLKLLVPPERYPDTWRQLARVPNDGPPRAWAGPILTKSGEERTIIWQNSTLGEGGQAGGTISFGVDITDRERAEREATRLLARDATLLATANDGIHVLDLDGNVLEANDAFCAMLGYGREELLLMNVADWDARWSDDELRAEISSFVAAGRTFQTVHRRRDGSLFDVEINSSAVVLDGQTYVYNAARDISERLRAERALNESADLFRTAMDGIPIAVAVLSLSPEPKLVLANAAAAELTGYSVDEIRQSGLLGSILHPADAPGVLEQVQHMLEGEAGDSGNMFRIVRADGALRTLETWTVPIMLSGEPALLLAATDVTERREIEQQLRELSYAVDQSPAAIVITDTNGEIGYVNRAFVEITGYSLDEAIGENPRMLKSGETPPDVYRQLWETISTGNAWHGEFHNRKKNGELFWESATISPVFDAAGRIRHFLAIKENITERKAAEEAQARAERALRRSDERLRATMAALPAALWEWDGERIIATNDAATTLTGYSKEEILAPGFLQRFISPAYLATAMTRAAARLRGEPVEANYELDVIRADARVMTFAVSAVPLHIGEAAYPTTLLACFDITERKQLEHRYLQAQKMEAVGQLAAGVAHDFNNLLTAIIGYTSFAREAIADEAQTRADLETVLGAAYRARDLTANLLAFARQQPVNPRVVDIAELVRDLAPLLRPLLGDAIELESSTSGAAPRALVDALRLEQVLMNLATNARDAMPAGGRLSIAVARDPGEVGSRDELAPSPYAVIRVSDTGLGMTDDVRAHIFEPFFTTKDVGKGTGLGLATCYGIIRQAGGDITVESSPGQGTTFSIFLPEVLDGCDEERESAGTAKPLGGAESIVLVEDDPTLRLLMTRALRQLGYRVREFSDALDAVPELAEPDDDTQLVISDVSMPRMSGEELSTWLARYRPEVPVLFVSGLGHESLGLHHDPGRVAFLQKPFAMADLVATARQLLDAPADGPSPARGLTPYTA